MAATAPVAAPVWPRAQRSNSAAGGEITCVDSGSYLGVFIDKSITINCEAAIGLSDGGLQVETAATDIVTLRGLDIDGTNFAGVVAGMISFTGAGVLHLQKVRLSNVPGSSFGLAFNPTDVAKLFVSDSTITDNGSSGISGGILIKPGTYVRAQVTITRTQIENNFFGIIADGGNGGIIRGAVRDSVVAGCANIGITVGSSPFSSVILLIDNTNVTNNDYGLVANGPTAGMAVRRSSIMFKNTGLFTVGGGVLGTYQDNRAGGNTTNGAFNAAAGLQ